MQTTANIAIYIQALGGKFLGPNAYNTDEIKLSISLQGKQIPISYRLTENVNDGGIGPDFLRSLPSTYGLSSFLPILTPLPDSGSEPAVNYLTPNNLTICGTISVTVSQPTELRTVSVTIPRPNAEDLVLTQSIALNQMQTDYRVIVIVPGLLLEQPPAAEIPNTPNSIFLYVKMMCGCPITTGIPNSYWAENDFIVTAEAIYKNGGRERISLTFLSDSTPSLFSSPVKDFANVTQVNFTARQKSSGNIGYLSVDYSNQQ